MAEAEFYSEVKEREIKSVSQNGKKVFVGGFLEAHPTLTNQAQSNLAQWNREPRVLWYSSLVLNFRGCVLMSDMRGTERIAISSPLCHHYAAAFCGALRYAS